VRADGMDRWCFGVRRGWEGLVFLLEGLRVGSGWLRGREGKGRETPCEIERLGERNARFYGWLFACVYDVM